MNRNRKDWDRDRLWYGVRCCVICTAFGGILLAFGVAFESHTMVQCRLRREQDSLRSLPIAKLSRN